mgnify:CR=1 FL=1
MKKPYLGGNPLSPRRQKITPRALKKLVKKHENDRSGFRRTSRNRRKVKGTPEVVNVLRIL